MKFRILLTFLIICSCQEHKTQLPILSYNYEDGQKVLYKIDNFEFTNQNGQIITSNSTQGQVHTMNFFFTSCPSICPPMRVKQQELAKAFSDEKRFRQYSISIDMKRDTTAQLSYYAKVHDIQSPQWQLLSALHKSQLDSIVEKLKTNFKPNEDGTDFYHSSYLALIDQDQYIRGFYNILVEEEVKLLIVDIKSLLK